MTTNREIEARIHQARLERDKRKIPGQNIWVPDWAAWKAHLIGCAICTGFEGGFCEIGRMTLGSADPNDAPWLNRVCVCGHKERAHTKLDGCMVSLSDDMGAPGTDCGDCPCVRFEERPTPVAPMRVPPQARRFGGESCCACDLPINWKPGQQHYALPMREGEVIENDDTGEWGGFDCCKACYEAHHNCGLAGLTIRITALAETVAIRSGLSVIRMDLAGVVNALIDEGL